MSTLCSTDKITAPLPASGSWDPGVGLQNSGQGANGASGGLNHGVSQSAELAGSRPSQRGRAATRKSWGAGADSQPLTSSQARTQGPGIWLQELRTLPPVQSLQPFSADLHAAVLTR